MPRTFDQIGLQVPQVWLPRPEIDLSRWAVVACDQYSSQPEYWQQVEAFVAEAPSTLRLVLPEIFLGEPGASQRIQKIQASMAEYLDQGVLVPYEGLVYVERKVGQKTRRGVLACLDLEQYDYHPGRRSLVRATEGTILDRLPPRMHIRQGAVLELPHILVLVDDPDQTVFRALERQRSRLQPLYDFSLMQRGGQLSGWLVTDPGIENQFVQALSALAAPQVFQQRYGLPESEPPLLFAVGDGNHSLAAAKAVWEAMKPAAKPGHPARYALVEIVNLHDPALAFEPIHRLLFNLRLPLLEALNDFFGSRFTYTPCGSLDAWDGVTDQVCQPQTGHTFGLVMRGSCGVGHLANPSASLPAGSLQAFLDHFMQQDGAEKIDYVHGRDVLLQLGARLGNAGFYLPAMAKRDLFKTVVLDGALPRKTFSMGEAHEKRFYMESRRIA